MGAGGDDKRKAGGEKRFEGCQDCSGWPEKTLPGPLIVCARFRYT